MGGYDNDVRPEERMVDEDGKCQVGQTCSIGCIQCKVGQYGKFSSLVCRHRYWNLKKDKRSWIKVSNFQISQIFLILIVNYFPFLATIFVF